MALDNSKNTKKLHKGERIRKDGRYEYRYRDKLGQDHSVYGTSLAELRQREEEISRLRFKGVLRVVSLRSKCNFAYLRTLMGTIVIPILSRVRLCISRHLTELQHAVGSMTMSRRKVQVLPRGAANVSSCQPTYQ